MKQAHSMYSKKEPTLIYVNNTLDSSLNKKKTFSSYTHTIETIKGNPASKLIKN